MDLLCRAFNSFLKYWILQEGTRNGSHDAGLPRTKV